MSMPSVQMSIFRGTARSSMRFAALSLIKERPMPRGENSSYTDKQKRQSEHIEEGYEKRGVSEKEAERRAWATVKRADQDERNQNRAAKFGREVMTQLHGQSSESFSESPSNPIPPTAEVQALREQLEKLQQRERQIMELIKCEKPERLMHDLRNIMNEIQLLRLLAKDLEQ
jgi:hypothetical protein